jgi:hypothetical protein
LLVIRVSTPTQHAGVFPISEKEDIMAHRKTFLILLVLITALASAPAYAAVTHSGGAVVKVTVVTETNSQSTSFAGFVDLPGAKVTITVPAGAKQLVQARFVGESGCMPIAGDNFWCSIQIVAVKASTTTRMLPDSGGDAAFDSVTGTQDNWEGHAVERSVVLPAGTYTVKVQWMVNDPFLTFSLDDWSFAVTQYAAGK